MFGRPSSLGPGEPEKPEAKERRVGLEIRRLLLVQTPMMILLLLLLILFANDEVLLSLAPFQTATSFVFPFKETIMVTR